MENEPEKKKTRTIKRAERKGLRQPDSDFAQKSRVFHKLFTLSIPAFNAKDAELTPAYADAWFAAIEAFESHTSDDNMVDKMQAEADFLDEYIKQVLLLVNDLEYFAGKAFKDKPRRMYEFAFDLIAKEARARSPKFLIHCWAASAIVDDYTAQLTAAGLPPNFNTDFDAYLGTGGSKFVSFELAKRERIRATTNRVDIYNELRDYWAKVRKVAALIYYNDKEALAMWERE